MFFLLLFNNLLFKDSILLFIDYGNLFVKYEIEQYNYKSPILCHAGPIGLYYL